MRYIIPNNLPELPSEDMTMEGLKKFVELIIDELDSKEALEFVQMMVSESEAPEELEICDHAVELVRQKFIDRIKSA